MGVSRKSIVTRSRIESGFTLIELLIVVVIVGLLASIAAVVFLNQRAAAIDATATADRRQIAVEAYNGMVVYPHASFFAIGVPGEDVPASGGVPGAPSVGSWTDAEGQLLLWVGNSRDDAMAFEFELSRGNHVYVYADASVGGYQVGVWNERGKRFDSLVDAVVYVPGG